MDVLKAYSRRSFVIVFFLTALPACLVNVAFHYGLAGIFRDLSDRATDIKAQVPQVEGLLNRIDLLSEFVRPYFLPVSAGIFLLTAFLIWAFLRGSVKKLLKQAQPPAKEKRRAAEAAAQEKENIQADRRLFLYLVSLFQREGRLLDFLAEDLNAYDDTQIGAAVRNIHESCKKVIQKNISPKPIMEKEEGEAVTVEPGFDPNAVKLTGNVTGEPPFKGVLRHRGWQARRMEMPTFTSGQDPSIIAPAEVEIL